MSVCFLLPVLLTSYITRDHCSYRSTRTLAPQALVMSAACSSQQAALAAQSTAWKTAFSRQGVCCLCFLLLLLSTHHGKETSFFSSSLQRSISFSLSTVSKPRTGTWSRSTRFRRSLTRCVFLVVCAAMLLLCTSHTFSKGKVINE